MAYKGGGGRGFRGGGGAVGGGGASRPQQNVRDKKEEIKNFLGFYKRTDSVCIDLYQPEFFRRKPTWEEMALFVSQQLCLSAPLRAALKDIQLHPVKKHLFLKFRNASSRDQVAAKLKAGVDWPAFEAKVHGWAMDKPVIVVRLHGVSPESHKQDIEAVMSQYGEVLDVDIGFISKKLLPGVTNGTWTVKMILDEEKVLPSFVFMKDEGEVWQVTHENQTNVCWKCGRSGHVGARCNQPTLTFDALQADKADKEGSGGGTGGGTRSWAHVVKTGGGLSRSGSTSLDGKKPTELEEQEALLKSLGNGKTVDSAQAGNNPGALQEGLVLADDAAQTEIAAQAKAAAQTGGDAEAVGEASTLTGYAVEGVARAEANAQVVAAALTEVFAEASNSVTGQEEVVVATEKISSQTEMCKQVKKKPRKKTKESNKKMRVDVSGQYSDVEMASGLDLSDDGEFDPAVTGIQLLGDDSDDMDSQATSKAGLSMATFGSCLPAGSGSQQLKVIVPEVNQSDSSSDSSPRHHKEASQSQEFQSDLSHRGFKEFLVAKDFDGVNSSEKL